MAVAPALPRSLRSLGVLVLLAAAAAAAWMWRRGQVSGELACLWLGSCAGLLPGALYAPEGQRSAPLRGWRRRLLLWAIPVASLGVALLPLLYPDPYEGAYVDAHPFFNKWPGAASLLALTPIAVACIWVRHPPSKYACDAVRCVLGLWLILVVWGSAGTIVLPFAEHNKASELLYIFIRTFVRHLEGPVVFVWTASLMARRLIQLELLQSFAAKRTRVLLGAMGAAYHCCWWVYDFSDFMPPWTYPVWLTFAMFVPSVWLFYTCLLLKTIVHSIALVSREARNASGAPRAEAAWAIKVLRLELAASLVLGVTTPLTWWTMVAFTMQLPDEFLPNIRPYVHRFDLVAHALSVAVLSGLLWQAGEPARHKFPAHELRRKTMPRPHTDVHSDGEEWGKKVGELAARGIRLGDLLDFWRRLVGGELMPGFDAKRSTTNDVVRRAIIPESRDAGGPSGGCALATIWSEGQPLQAECMVTHNWSNLFLHLTAAVVADGLGADCYEGLAVQLLSAEGTAELRKALDSNGLLNKVYWVCAFSVNQHAGICGGFGEPPMTDTPQRTEWESKRRDTVTQEVFPVCNCQRGKLLSDDSSSSEMNKFDDMMRLLSEVVDNFSHLVVVDARFEVFHRAWCVAEIVESGICGIPQRIKIHSLEMLDLHYQSLSSLDVRECRASRPKDRETILAKIRDIDAFNDSLQWAIFGTKGLFSEWVDGQQRSVLIRRIVNRALHVGQRGKGG